MKWFNGCCLGRRILMAVGLRGPLVFRIPTWGWMWESILVQVDEYCCICSSTINRPLGVVDEHAHLQTGLVPALSKSASTSYLYLVLGFGTICSLIHDESASLSLNNWFEICKLLLKKSTKQTSKVGMSVLLLRNIPIYDSITNQIITSWCLNWNGELSIKEVLYLIECNIFYV